MDNTNAQQPAQPGTSPEQQPKPVLTKKEEPFSIQWHLKALAIIYGCLAVLYIVLRIFLK